MCFGARLAIYGRMTASATIPYVKMNGLGNEIVIVDLRASGKVFAAREVEAIAGQPRSHFDQMMVLHAARTKGTECYVRIYNSDGSEAGACGNGMRCVAHIDRDRRRVVDFAIENTSCRLDLERVAA